MKAPLTYFLLIGLAALSLRFMLLYAIGPQSFPDTAQYLEVSRNLADTGTFTLRDPDTGVLRPFALRVPVFHAFTAALMKVPGQDIGRQVAFLNILLSTAIVLLTGIFFSSLAGPLTGLLAACFLALDPNSVYNSVVVLPDTLFSLFVLLAAVTGLKALRRGTIGWFMIWGLVIGMSTMVKPVFKYFWAVPLLILACERTLRERAFRKGAIFLLGFALILGPWLARNYEQLDFAGLELNFGLSTIWSTMDLVKASTAEQQKKDPMLGSVRNIVAAASDPMAAIADIKAQLRLTDVEVNSYLLRIGKEVFLENPAEFGRRYLKNAGNFLTSPSSALELYYKVSPGGEKNRKQIKEAVTGRLWGTVLVNLAARAVGLAVFLLSLYGLLLLAGRERPAALLLLSMLAYLTLISSFTAGYDRYRLPIDPLLAGLCAIWINAKFLKKYNYPHPRATGRPD